MPEPDEAPPPLTTCAECHRAVYVAHVNTRGVCCVCDPGTGAGHAPEVVEAPEPEDRS